MTINFTAIMYVAAAIFGLNYFVVNGFVDFLTIIAAIGMWGYVLFTAFYSTMFTIGLLGIRSITLTRKTTTPKCPNIFNGVVVIGAVAAGAYVNGYIVTAWAVGIVGVWSLWVGYSLYNLARKTFG